MNSLLYEQALKFARKFSSHMILGLLVDRISYLPITDWFRSVRRMQAVAPTIRPINQLPD